LETGLSSQSTALEMTTEQQKILKTHKIHNNHTTLT